MSYVRFSDASDVYVYADVNGYIRCCMCRLDDDWNTSVADEPTMAKEMMAHLDRHRTAGDQVPEVAYERLRCEAGISSAATGRSRTLRCDVDCEEHDHKGTVPMSAGRDAD